MKQKVKVSVLMAAYNGERHITQAIRSVLRQKGVPFELLIGDDASSDGTWEKVEEHRSDPRVRAWRFRRRAGVAGNPNRLLSRARGKYISICEQDDIMLPGNLRRLASVLDRSPATGVVSGPRSVLDEKGRIRKDTKFQPGRFLAWDLVRSQVPHGGTMIRRNCMRRVGGYNPTLKLAADCDLFLRLAEITRFRTLNGRPVYIYRRWAGSESFRPRSLRRQKQTIREIIRQTIRRRYGLSVPW